MVLTIHHKLSHRLSEISNNSLQDKSGISRVELKGLELANWEYNEAKIQKCFEGERKVKSSHSKKCILENNQSCLLSSKIGPGQLSVGCQAVRIMDARRSSLSWKFG